MFLAEELPVRLAHRVKELDELPHNLSEMHSIKKVKNWYAQSFEVSSSFSFLCFASLTAVWQELIHFPPVVLPDHVRQAMLSLRQDDTTTLPESTPNPSVNEDDSPYPYPHHFQTQLRASQQKSQQSPSASASASGTYTFSHPTCSSKLRLRVPMERRYYSRTDLSTYPPEVYDYNSRFTKLLRCIKTRHDPTVTTVAQGVLEWKRLMGAPNINLDIQAWLDRFYMSRIGIRFLIGQHVALNTHQAHHDYVGIICTQANVHDILQEAIENARFVCEEHYAMFRGPPVQLICPRELSFAYVPGHLSHIVFELLKNSLRAVVERHGVENESRFPPIKVVVVEGTEDITIKISDEGGGIPRSAIPLIWTYMYTTMNNLQIDQDYSASDFKAPMAGFGYGLPLSRLYARYFGGEIKLISMDGFGTDVYIHLNRLSSSREPLP